MIIHNPEITGSLIFPRTDGTKVVMQISDQGVLETVEQDATGSATGNIPASNFSGSFTGSFKGDGSQITGVAASSLNIDLFTAGTIAGDDELLFSDTDDSGNEKRGTFKSGLDSLTVVSGSSQVEFNDVNNNPFSQSASTVTVSKAIVPSSATIDLGTAANPFRDVYISSASLYIDGTQVLSSTTSELTITTDTNQSLKLVETGVDTVQIQTENGDITFTSTGTGNIELDAPIQIVAGNQILSSDGNAIQFGEDISITGNITVTGTVDGVDVASLNSSFGTLSGKTLVSGSSQIDVEQTTNFTAFSASIASTFDGLSSNYADLIGIPVGIVSSSAQVSSYGVFAELNGDNLVSGSSQVVLESADKTGFTGASSITTLGTVTSGNVTAILPVGVVSGSTQILTLVSIDEDNMATNSDTKLPTQQSVKAYVDTQVAGLVDSAPGALDTLNELAAALGDDANFSTTISNTIAGKVSQSLQIISGNGLTGGGNLTTNRTLNVVGTTDRISVSADAVDIAATYVGQSSITTLGTITTGTWNGSVIASAYLDADTAHLSGTQTFSGTKTFSSAVTISNSTASTSTTTGALKVTGGVGVGGDIFAGADVVAYASSDERLKDSIELISDPIGKVQSLKGVTWEWNDNASEAAKQSPNVGVIAQDVEKVLPQLVHDRENGYKGVDYAKLTGLLIEAIKEQQKQIDDLKSKLG